MTTQAARATRIEIHTEQLEMTPHLRKSVETAIFAAIGRFAHRVRGITVRLSSDTGDYEPVISVCSVVVRLHPAGEIRARGTDFRWDLAIARACQDMGRSLERELHRTDGQRVAEIPTP